jgi:hypothetical protein
MKKLCILQSGFLGVNEDCLSRPVKHNDIVVNDILSKDFLNENNINFYCSDTSVLYKLSIEQPNLLKDFDYREKIIKNAFTVFGTNSLQEWIEYQNKSHMLTPNHVEFIEDTLRFICGYDRKLDIQQWERLVTINRIKNENRISYIKHFDIGENNSVHKLDAFNDDYMYLQYKEKHESISLIKPTLPGCIHQWISKREGFIDLITSLNIIFGIDKGITSVAEKY